jgi:C-terminal processing protease CtpA/Prc
MQWYLYNDYQKLATGRIGTRTFPAPKAGDLVILFAGKIVPLQDELIDFIRNRLHDGVARVAKRKFRKGEKDVLDFTIIRDKIPINSLDAAYMLDRETGYVKLNKFAATTEKEFETALLFEKKAFMNLNQNLF